MLLDEIKNLKATPKELRKFGLTIGIFLLIIAAWLFWKQRPGFPYFAYAGGCFALIGLILPILLKPVYKVWMIFAMAMGFVMTRVILTVLFFGLFTPIALLAKLLGKDLLEQRWDKKATTYWVKRPKTPFDPKSAENMF
ncbi:MAG: SxtJ family membrane protein [candidate division KSB1 bacterium]|nr:SxtJ family membrane protein [candidate division KSB1 bacterium]MDZ7301247.1 SxtJ family membrane protein [candidate division KSB1 bacterium]MDZ7310529.1 SxtJ family membrane protein [candidate division KSB1 bacterium]